MDAIELQDFTSRLEAAYALRAKREADQQPPTQPESNEPMGLLMGTTTVSWTLKVDDALYVWRPGRLVLQWTIDTRMDSFADFSASDVMERFSVGLQETIQSFFGVRPTISTPHPQ